MFVPIHLQEFLLAIDVTSSGTPEEKLKWAFRMYDVDGNGVIDIQEMTKIVQVSDDWAVNGDTWHIHHFDRNFVHAVPIIGPRLIRFGFVSYTLYTLFWMWSVDAIEISMQISLNRKQNRMIFFRSFVPPDSERRVEAQLFNGILCKFRYSGVVDGYAYTYILTHSRSTIPQSVITKVCAYTFH